MLKFHALINPVGRGLLTAPEESVEQRRDWEIAPYRIRDVVLNLIYCDTKLEIESNEMPCGEYH